MPQRLFIIALIIVAFLAFMVTYTVRFTETAVVTTFGRADEGSVKTSPGLRFKVPYIQQVTKYDSRTRYLETNQETQQTADDSPVLVTAYLTWKIDDPLKFFKKFSASGDSPRDHYKEAEKVLKTELRSAMGEVSRYRFGELLSADEKASKLAELEGNIFANLSQSSGSAAPGTRPASTSGALAECGITVKGVGITRLGLPQNTTRTVFERMNSERARLADKAIQEGEAEANALRSGANSDAEKITSFTEALAARIRNQGDIEAAQWIKMVNANPQLAVFIKNLALIREGFGGNSRATVVLPTSLPGLGLLRPDALNTLKEGEIPSVDLSGLKSDKPVSSVETREPAAPGANR